MRLSFFLCLLLTACASFTPNRQIASRKDLSAQSFDLSLSQNVVVANGLNEVVLTISGKDNAGNAIPLKSFEFEIVTSIEAKIGDIFSSGNGFKVTITPKLKSPSIKIFVSTKDGQSQPILLKTTLLPLREKMLPLPSGPTNNTSLDGFNLSRQDNFPEGQYEGYRVSNNGPNKVVSAEDASREFSFDFEEQARQNISILVNDSPNGTSSHAMYSEFVLFPRLIIPYAEIQKNNETLVTLTNGEEIRFNKDGEIIEGVFEEGPVDVGPNRFTRIYADLKYRGKGILLRANARGQMPQQGQFEDTKIDMEYGSKYSADVLIINGTTGERCRRPKKDFWDNADVSPIEFKFPSDAEFDTYLKANCKFGIPDIKLDTDLEGKDLSSSTIPLIWQDCKDEFEIRTCIDQQIKNIPHENDRSRAKFEMKRLLFKAKQEEAETISDKVSTEMNNIRPKLLSDLSWVRSSSEAQIKEDCLNKSMILNTLKFRFHNSPSLMRAGLVSACSSIKNELTIKASTEVKNLMGPLSSDFAWVNLSNGQSFTMNCQKEFLKRYTNLDFQKVLDLYSDALVSSCSEIENLSGFKSWLSRQSSVVEDRLFLKVQAYVSVKADAQAQTCVATFPMDTALNRLRYKKQREACLVDAWPGIEVEALAEAKKDPLALKVGVSAANLVLRLDKDRRVNQLRLMKKYFVL